MRVTMIVETPIIAAAVDAAAADVRRANPYCVSGLSRAEAEQYVRDEIFADDELSQWGINSDWCATDLGDGRWLIAFGGPRHSLHDWLPAGWLDEAHRQWLAGELIAYESQRWDVSPRVVGLAPVPEWEPTAEQLGSASYDAEPGDGRCRPRTYGQLHPAGAFGTMP